MRSTLFVTAILLLMLTLMLAAKPASTSISTQPAMSMPELKDTVGKKIGSATVGQLVVISTTVVNNRDSVLPFTAIIEVRDESDVTVYLRFQIGDVNANGQSEIGLSWLPKDEGSYQLRAFAISNFTRPQVLAWVKTSEVSVIQSCDRPYCSTFGDASYAESYTKIQASEQSFIGLFTYDFDEKCQSMILQRCTPYKLDGVSIYTGSENFHEFVGHEVEVIGKKHVFELEGYHLEEIWPVRIMVLN